MQENTNRPEFSRCFKVILGCILLSLLGCEQDDDTLIEGGEPLPPGSDIGRTSTQPNPQGSQGGQGAGDEMECDGIQDAAGNCFARCSEAAPCPAGQECKAAALANGDQVNICRPTIASGISGNGVPSEGAGGEARPSEGAGGEVRPSEGGDTGEGSGGMSTDPSEAIGAACEDGQGFCWDAEGESASACVDNSGSFVFGLCPGGDNIQCCQDFVCTTGEGEEGTCKSSCENGFTAPGLCPGNADITCCIPFRDVDADAGDVPAGGSFSE